MRASQLAAWESRSIRVTARAVDERQIQPPIRTATNKRSIRPLEKHTWPRSSHACATSHFAESHNGKPYAITTTRSAMKTKAQEDFFNAYQRMTEQERLLLEVFASRYIGGTPYSSPMDIIHEVIIKVMDGKRHWPADVDVAVFIASSVRSIASTSRNRAEMLNIPLDALHEEDDCGMRARYEPVISTEDVVLLTSARRSRI